MKKWQEYCRQQNGLSLCQTALIKEINYTGSWLDISGKGQERYENFKKTLKDSQTMSALLINLANFIEANFDSGSKLMSNLEKKCLELCNAKPFDPYFCSDVDYQFYIDNTDFRKGYIDNKTRPSKEDYHVIKVLREASRQAKENIATSVENLVVLVDDDFVFVPSSLTSYSK